MSKSAARKSAAAARRTRQRRSDAARQAAMVRRIIAAWEAASADDLADGIDWYDRAQAAAAAIAAQHGGTTAQAAAIIAALSPRNRWSVNVAQAARVAQAAAQGRPCPAVSTTANRAKAWAAAQAADPAAILTGPKVRRFFANIMGDDQAVTVDVWAARIAEGRRDDRAPSGRRYDMIEAAYQAAAAIIGTSPRNVQAATWVAIRGSAH